MNVLTDDIKSQIRNGWKVAIEKDDTLLVYDVISKDDDEIVGKERWIVHPAADGKPIEEVKKTLPPLTGLSEEELEKLRDTQTVFAKISLKDVVSCLSAADGNTYTVPEIQDKYSSYE